LIRAYVGLMGQGKTLSMVRHALRELKNGRRIITNTPFKYFALEKKPPLFQRLLGKKSTFSDLTPEYVDTKDLLRLLKTEKQALFLIDEASIVFSNYGKELLDGDWVMRFAQIRKMGVEMWYTTQRFQHVHSRLRDLTFEVVSCEKMSPKLFGNFWYHPDAFMNTKMPPAMRQKFILDREFIWPWELKGLFAAYDTEFTVGESATIKHESTTVLQNESKFLFDQFVSPPPIKEDFTPGIPKRLVL